MKAFPLTQPSNYDQRGMDLRDYFAAAALQGYLASHAGLDVPMPDHASAAHQAYLYADLMLKERERK